MGRRTNKRKDKHQGLTWYQARRLKCRLRSSSPSEPWVEAQIVVVDDADPHGNAIHYVLHDPSVFPPGGLETRMVRCRICGIYNPPNAMEGGCCLDHARHKGWGRSLSAKAIQAMERRKAGMHFCPLLREDIEGLQLEIEKFNRRQAKKCRESGAFIKPVVSTT
jgi:hypothetical protein